MSEPALEIIIPDSDLPYNGNFAHALEAWGANPSTANEEAMNKIKRNALNKMKNKMKNNAKPSEQDELLSIKRAQNYEIEQMLEGLQKNETEGFDRIMQLWAKFIYDEVAKEDLLVDTTRMDNTDLTHLATNFNNAKVKILEYNSEIVDPITLEVLYDPVQAACACCDRILPQVYNRKSFKTMIHEDPVGVRDLPDLNLPGNANDYKWCEICCVNFTGFQCSENHMPQYYKEFPPMKGRLKKILGTKQLWGPRIESATYVKEPTTGIPISTKYKEVDKAKWNTLGYNKQTKLIYDRYGVKEVVVTKDIAFTPPTCMKNLDDLEAKQEIIGELIDLAKGEEREESDAGEMVEIVLNGEFMDDTDTLIDVYNMMLTGVKLKVMSCKSMEILLHKIQIFLTGGIYSRGMEKRKDLSGIYLGDDDGFERRVREISNMFMEGDYFMTHTDFSDYNQMVEIFNLHGIIAGEDNWSKAGLDNIKLITDNIKQVAGLLTEADSMGKVPSNKTNKKINKESSLCVEQIKKFIKLQNSIYVLVPDFWVFDYLRLVMTNNITRRKRDIGKHTVQISKELDSLYIMELKSKEEEELKLDVIHLELLKDNSRRVCIILSDTLKGILNKQLDSPWSLGDDATVGIEYNTDHSEPFNEMMKQNKNILKWARGDEDLFGEEEEEEEKIVKVVSVEGHAGFNIKSDDHKVITVQDGSPSTESGLKVGMFLTHFNGIKVSEKWVDTRSAIIGSPKPWNFVFNEKKTQEDLFKDDVSPKELYEFHRMYLSGKPLSGLRYLQNMMHQAVNLDEDEVEQFSNVKIAWMTFPPLTPLLIPEEYTNVVNVRVVTDGNPLGFEFNDKFIVTKVDTITGINTLTVNNLGLKINEHKLTYFNRQDIRKHTHASVTEMIKKAEPPFEFMFERLIQPVDFGLNPKVVELDGEGKPVFVTEVVKDIDVKAIGGSKKRRTKRKTHKSKRKNKSKRKKNLKRKNRQLR